uniref:RING-type E3 ubiquitin transferase n=1 Tax=Suricata suricatta TaxID=37032 RepID=A0A673TMX5_SURSU
ASRFTARRHAAAPGALGAPGLPQPEAFRAATSLPRRPGPGAAAPTAPVRSPECPLQPTSPLPARLSASPQTRAIGRRRRGGAERSALPAAARIPGVTAIGCGLRQSWVEGAPPRGAGLGLAPPRPPRGPASPLSRLALARRSASFAEQVHELSTRLGRLLSRGARRACCAPSEVPARISVPGPLGPEHSPVRGNLGFRTRCKGRRFAIGTRRRGWKSCMNVEAISRVIAVCYHDNQPLQSPARSAARLHQLGCACGEDRGGLWQPREWAAAVCHASFGQGRAAAVDCSTDPCHPEWLRNPGPQHEKRTLFGDMVCFLFITPLATISGWLCLRGAVDHLHFSSRLEAVGLIALTVALFTIYLFWTLVSFRYHCRLYNEWRRTNQRVILLIPKSVSIPSNQQSLLGPHSVKRNSKETIV